RGKERSQRQDAIPVTRPFRLEREAAGEKKFLVATLYISARSSITPASSGIHKNRRRIHICVEAHGGAAMTTRRIFLPAYLAIVSICCIAFGEDVAPQV